MKVKKKSIVRCHHKRPPLMLTSIEVNQIHSLAKQSLSISKIAQQTGLSRNTVKKYLRSPLERKPGRISRDNLEEKNFLIREWFIGAEGNCAVVQRKFEHEFGVSINPRRMRRFCEKFRTELKPILAPSRYETGPGQQMQIDFGQKEVKINGQWVRIHFFVAILGFSRSIFVKAYTCENQATWLNGLEQAFKAFGGVPCTVLSDNSRCLIQEHRKKGAIQLTSAYQNFCEYWRIKAIASSPYHPQSKGKVERAVRYVKTNALVLKDFESLEDLNQWLERWRLTIADQRVLNDLANGLKTPKERLELEKGYLMELKPRAYSVIEENRKVDSAGLIRVENNFYRLPNSYANKDVQILVHDNVITVSRKGVFIIELDKARSVYHPKPQIEDPQRVNVPVSLASVENSRFVFNPLGRNLEVYEAVTKRLGRGQR